MSNIDSRVVELKFDNKGFERGVEETLKSLDDLNKKLDLSGATKGLDAIANAGSHFSLSGMADSIDNISSKFSIMGAVGFSAIQNLTNSALNAAKNAIGGAFGAVFQGGKTRALNLEQANFSLKGLGLNAKQVKLAMSDALYAVQGTAFGLDSAAKAAPQLLASKRKDW